ncbi:MAG TPA: hypothetical protein PLW46_06890, partial [Acinetobacter johnsonii]|nr:hypothetical protein [Acinetobacter johnsonii]
VYPVIFFSILASLAPENLAKLAWILTNKKRPAATERSEQIQMEF